MVLNHLTDIREHMTRSICILLQPHPTNIKSAVSEGSREDFFFGRKKQSS